MIADEIKTTDISMQDRGLPADSYFEIEFTDGSIRHEENTNWSEMTETLHVEYFGNHKTVFVCKFPVKKIRVRHMHLETTMEVPEGCQVYQAMRSDAFFTPASSSGSVIGRCVGLVKDGRVIEEKTLYKDSDAVLGMKN